MKPRALLWLGANVVIAEINQQNGLKAAETLAGEFNCDRLLFVRTDVGNEIDVNNLYRRSVAYFRPHNRHSHCHNLYFVGASTHPGTGIPTALVSGRLTAQRIIDDYHVRS